jgi:hypothetical protein
MKFIREVENSIVNFIWKHEKPWRQSYPEQKEQHWRYHNISLQTVLQSHSNTDSMVLAQKANM